MVEVEKKGSSYWWWLDSHNEGKRNRSPWLQSTLSELDEKTKTMLRLIEEEADSFAQRAEMYYNRRPEIIGMVEDFYRAHRSLAERYDQVKFESGPRLLTARSSPLPFTKLHLDTAYDSNRKAYEPEDSDASEVDDPEEDHTASQMEEVPCGSCNEELMRLREELETLREQNKAQKEEKDHAASETKEVPCGCCNEDLTRLREELERLREENNVQKEEDHTASQTQELPNGSCSEELMMLREESERLREENKVQKEQLMQKDEEKRDVIRQLSLAMDLLKEENLKLGQCVIEKNLKKGSSQELNNSKGVFFGRLFSKS